MKDLTGQLAKDWDQYKLFLSTLFTLATTDENRRTIYESLVASEEYVRQINDIRVRELYARVLEDFRLSISRAITDSDYRAFFDALVKKANEVEAVVNKHVADLEAAAK